MRKNLLKFAALSVVAVMSMSVLAACGAKTEEEAPVETETTETVEETEEVVEETEETEEASEETEEAEEVTEEAETEAE